MYKAKMQVRNPNLEKSAALASGCVTIFGLPFAVVGVISAYLLLSTIFDWHRMQAWVETPAQITSLNLEVHRGNKGSKTYKVVAKYRYMFDGAPYTSERVGISSMSDNLGSYHQERYNELLKVQQSGIPTPCYVNPHNPSEAVLFRDVRFGLLLFYTLFMVLFGGVGIALVFSGFFARKSHAQEQKLKAQFPSEPWRQNLEWSSPIIRSGSKTTMVTSIGFALFWNLISTPLLIFLPEEILTKHNYKAAIGLLFPIVGIGLAWYAVLSFLRWKRFGSSHLEMKSFPAVIGETLRGTVHCSADLSSAENITLKLICEERKQVRRGGKTRTDTEILWESVRTLSRGQFSTMGGSTIIPVELPIDGGTTPYNRDPGRTVMWKIECEAKISGVDLFLRFEVPVVKREEA